MENGLKNSFGVQWIYSQYVKVFTLACLSVFAIACGGEGEDVPTTVPATTQAEESSVVQINLGDVQFLNFNDAPSINIQFEEDFQQASYMMMLHSSNVKEGHFGLSIKDGGSATSDAQEVAAYQMDPVAAQVASEDHGHEGNPMHELSQAWAEVFAHDSDKVPAFRESSDIGSFTAELTLGLTKPFRVLNSLDSIHSYNNIDARLRYIDSNIQIYVDTEMDGSEYLTDSDILSLAQKFSGHAMPIERDIFGLESDVNQDGRVSIVMTPQLNRICLPTGIVTGFFFPGDLYQRGANNPASNEQEVFYSLVPDPEAEFCRTLGVDFTINNILPGVLAHEFQHMISFNQHVFVNGGVTEESWLNEALSHLAEDVTGFGQENYARAKLFLEQANDAALIPAGLPTLAERGMGYLFIRYLYEQARDGAQFVRFLLDTDQTGVGNIEAALIDGSQFNSFAESFSYWQVALLMSGTDSTQDPRLVYESRFIDPVTGNYQGICLRCEAQDGRGTHLDGPKLETISSFPVKFNVRSTGTRFLRVDQPGLQLSVQGSEGAKLGGALIRLENTN